MLPCRTAAYGPTQRGRKRSALTGGDIRDNRLPERPRSGISQPQASMNSPHRPHQAVSCSQAIDNSPSLARLAGMVRESNDLLQSVTLLLPATMRSAVKAGPIDGDTWCLLVVGNAAAAKVRQLLPTLQARLKADGHSINAIRLKVMLAQPKSL